MSVTLSINWPDQEPEVIPFASLASARETWGGLGKDLELKWVPLFYQFVPVHSGNLDEICAEMQSVRTELVRRGGNWLNMLPTADRIIDALEKLRLTSGWDASFG